MSDIEKEAKIKAHKERLAAEGLVARELAEALRFETHERDVSEILAIHWTTATRAAAINLAVELYHRGGVKACHVCACTEAKGCSGGCAWASDDALSLAWKGTPVCTRCAGELVLARARLAEGGRL